MTVYQAGETIPGEVQKVWDNENDSWIRTGGGWVPFMLGDSCEPIPEAEMLAEFGPVTDKRVSLW